MKITFLELRRDPGRLMEALDRNEEVTISRRGRDIARVVPSGKRGGSPRVRQHPAFGMWAGRAEEGDPAAHVRKLRKGRYDDL